MNIARRKEIVDFFISLEPNFTKCWLQTYQKVYVDNTGYFKSKIICDKSKIIWQAKHTFQKIPIEIYEELSSHVKMSFSKNSISYRNFFNLYPQINRTKNYQTPNPKYLNSIRENDDDLYALERVYQVFTFKGKNKNQSLKNINFKGNLAARIDSAIQKKCNIALDYIKVENNQKFSKILELDIDIDIDKYISNFDYNEIYDYSLLIIQDIIKFLKTYFNTSLNYTIFPSGTKGMHIQFYFDNYINLSNFNCFILPLIKNQLKDYSSLKAIESYGKDYHSCRLPFGWDKKSMKKIEPIDINGYLSDFKAKLNSAEKFNSVLDTFSTLLSNSISNVQGLIGTNIKYVRTKNNNENLKTSSAIITSIHSAIQKINEYFDNPYVVSDFLSENFKLDITLKEDSEGIKTKENVPCPFCDHGDSLEPFFVFKNNKYGDVVRLACLNNCCDFTKFNLENSTRLVKSGSIIDFVRFSFLNEGVEFSTFDAVKWICEKINLNIDLVDFKVSSGNSYHQKHIEQLNLYFIFLRLFTRLNISELFNNAKSNIKQRGFVSIEQLVNIVLFVMFRNDKEPNKPIYNKALINRLGNDEKVYSKMYGNKILKKLNTIIENLGIYKIESKLISNKTNNHYLINPLLIDTEMIRILIVQILLKGLNNQLNKHNYKSLIDKGFFNVDSMMDTPPFKRQYFIMKPP